MFIELGDNKRMFISPSFGCKVGCKYCYVPDINSKQIREVPKVDKQFIAKCNAFNRGRRGTVFSIGCYCDPFAPENHGITLNLLEELTLYENYIQVSTKFSVTNSSIEKIKEIRKHKNQVTVFISCPTISQDYQLEPNCSPALDRLKEIKNLNQKGIPVVLYIKPFLKAITTRDIALYERFLTNTTVPVVVGQYFTKGEVEDSIGIAPVGNGALSTKGLTEESKEFSDRLSKITTVYSTSMEVIENYRM